ncbi:type II secretion system minor pseudopilin GspI, partial [Pseudomonas aeruginosa]
ALLAAESRLAELRLGVGAAPGNSDFECSQGRLRLYCEQRVEATDDPALLWVEIRVRTQREQAVPLATLKRGGDHRDRRSRAFRRASGTACS